MVWKTKWKIYRFQQFIKDVGLFIKQCYFIVWRVESKDPKVVKTKKGRTMLLPKCQVFNSKISRCITEREASKLSSSLGIKIPAVAKLLAVSDILF